MSRYIEADALTKEIKQDIIDDGLTERYVFYRINEAPSIDIVFCKECKHRPVKEDASGVNFGFNIIAPNGDERCPCLVEDGWYSWMPKDNFYCGYGEREGE